ncbi:hypothetical protein N7348_09410 [Brucella anthropi]|uniref:hypothetical protein n=1 Tax=Brucella anthropi TaxID=529 RepID=UPI0021083FFC|nr:hypothetical protein [Brucella anthropi]MDH0367156.1 hypothetical protein [Brucella anthropi]
MYVNAGVVVPPVAWLKALKPGGRMIFPWQPVEGIGLAVLMTRMESAFAVRPLMPACFIPCIGASDANQCTASDQKPGETAVAIFPDMWFSTLDCKRKRWLGKSAQLG